MNKSISILVMLCVLLWAPPSFSDEKPKSSSNPQSAIRNPQSNNPQSSEIDIASLGKPVVRVFTIKDGLPQNAPISIVSDRRGYLWVGTLNGAAYYNGQKWTTVDLPNRNASKWISDILAASDGSIWFGRLGGGISILKDGQWSVFDANSGLPSDVVFDLMETTSREGERVMWAATSGGIARLQAGKWNVYNADSGLPNNEALCLLETDAANSERVLWAGTSGGLARLEAGKWTVYDKSGGLPDNRVQALLESADEDGERVLWVGTNEGLAKLKRGKWTVYDKSNGLPNSAIPAHGLLETVLSDGKRALWAGTIGGGVARLQNGEWTIYNSASGLPDNTIAGLYESVSPDGVRTLWVGTFVGLAQISFGKWIAFDSSSGLPNSVVFGLQETVSTDAGRAVWIGTYGGGLARFQNGKWTIYDAETGLPTNKIISLLETKTGGSQFLWAGTDGAGLARLENRRWTVYDTRSGLPNNYVNSLLETVGEDGSRSLWAGTYGGLARFQNGKWTVYNTASGLPSNIVWCLLETVSPEGSHSLWAGTQEGLARLENGKWTVYNTASGLPGNRINTLLYMVSPEGTRTLWAGTGSGVCRMDPYANNPRTFTLSETTSPALPDNTVYQIREDSRRRIYLFTNKGVARLTPRSTGGPEDRPYDIYTFKTEDGLPSDECNQNGSMVDSLGRIWAGTVAGAAMLDPSREIEDKTPKPLYVERAIMDGKERELSNVSLSHKENNITFEFALLSFFREKEIRYQTQLLGFDEKTTEWTARYDRVYTNLPNGDYVFKVWGRDYAGNISGPQEIKFKIRPAPWLTWWAYLLYSIGLASVGYGGYRYRFQMLERRNQMLEAKVQDRTAELSKKNEALDRMNKELLESHRRADRIFSALAESLPGTVLDGKYRLDEKIGSGGFGAVYRAAHLAMKRPIAVKIFKPVPGNDSAEALMRFEQEAVSACRINHPNAVAVLDSGTSSEGIAYLVMELLEGHSLADELKRRGVLSLGRSAEILVPLCDVLSKAHASGIIHRDIKPENIFLHRGNGEECVKVVDFGIAKLVGEEWGTAAQSLTGTGALIGTPVYMAPERLSNKPYSGKADVYSVGVMLYEMLCGRPPFQAGSGEVFALVQMHLMMEPLQLRLFNPHIPEAIEATVLRALAKDPESRQDALELKREFLSALDLDPQLEPAGNFKQVIYEKLGQESETAEFDAGSGGSASTSESIAGLNSKNWDKAEEIFYSALECEPDRRAAFLDEACVGDEQLRKRVAALIAADEKADEVSFLRSPAAGIGNEPSAKPADSAKPSADGKPQTEK